MVRIDINSGGAVSIRNEDQHLLDDSRTVILVESRQEAERLVMKNCAWAYPDDVVKRIAPGGMGQESLEAKGYTGYICDVHALVEKRFRTE